jgi:biotin-dependent carboxylase-like uncharacterized protein
MREARLTVTACGPLVSYQDGGRFGMLRFGVPASGAMDRFAHAAAQTALGRPQGATAIEVSLGGLELVCAVGEVTCCVTGGGFQVVLNGAVGPAWCVRTLRAGDVLAIRPGAWGSWACLAFLGELVCPSWAGSTATHVTSGLGGGLLARGSTVVVRDPQVATDREGLLPVPDLARARTRARVVLGPQTARFEPEAVATFLSTRFAVTPACDRMGMRLAGPALPLRDALSIPSEPLVRGAVQVNGDGVASVLLADHQTTGGYPKIATLLSSDLDGVAQLRPGDALAFEAVTAQEGVRIVRAQAQVRRDCLQAMARPRGSLETRLWQENLVSGVVNLP